MEYITTDVNLLLIAEKRKQEQAAFDLPVTDTDA